MKRFATIITTMLVFSTTAFSQGITLSKLIEMANCKSLSAFDIKARAEGYKFKSSKDSEKPTIYLYTKEIESSEKYFTLLLWYNDYSDQKPTIHFKVSSTAFPNLISQIKSQASQSGFTETSDSPSKDETSITFYYKNGKYKLIISDRSVEKDGSSYNEYDVSIFLL